MPATPGGCLASSGRPKGERTDELDKEVSDDAGGTNLCVGHCGRRIGRIHAGFGGRVDHCAYLPGNHQRRGGVDRTLSCPNDVAAGYFVKGVGANRTGTDAEVSAPDFIHVFIARDTEAYAFLSRIVLSVTVHLETVPFVGSGPHNYRVTIACVALASSAWRVLG
jgi:hypothetical protein